VRASELKNLEQGFRGFLTGALAVRLYDFGEFTMKQG
jgi:hypothetical protein